MLLKVIISTVALLSACGAPLGGGGPSPPVDSAAHKLTASSSLCASPAYNAVYKYNTGPGAPPACACALLRGVNAGTNAADLFVLYPAPGLPANVNGAAQGTSAGQWHTDWTAANCP